MTANPSKRLAWSYSIAFDSKHRQDPEDSHKVQKKKSKEKQKRLAVGQWRTDVQSLVSSSKWLQRYGLKRNKLSLSQILSQIGFQHRKDYVTTLGKPVASRYADGLFPQYKRAQDGSVYNLTAKKELILHFVDCLIEAIELYKQRMEWLTSESRQIFGVIQEQCIVIVLDFGTAAPTEFDLCRDALSMVLVEQVIQISRFNLIRAAQDLTKWQQKCTPVSERTVKSAVRWLWKLEHMTAVSHSSSAEALLEAMADEATWLLLSFLQLVFSFYMWRFLRFPFLMTCKSQAQDQSAEMLQSFELYLPQLPPGLSRCHSMKCGSLIQNTSPPRPRL